MLTAAKRGVDRTAALALRTWDPSRFTEIAAMNLAIVDLPSVWYYAPYGSPAIGSEFTTA
jgi:hypothetical protein